MIDTLELYFKAAQSAKIGIWKMNLQTNDVFWDAVTKHILEVPEDFEPIRGSGISFYTEGENRDKIKRLINNAMNDGISFEDKFQIKTTNNNIKYIECICQVEIVDGVPTQLLGTFQDITKEQNLINELQLNVEKFSSIFSSANDAIFIIDTSNGIITDYNPRAAELTGYNSTELLGLHNSDLFPIEYQKQVRYFLAYNLTRDDYTVNEACIKTKLGASIPVEIASGKKFEVNYKTYLVCFIRDVTLRIEKEIELKQLLEVTSQQNDKLYNFTHIVSHNIRSHTSNLAMIVDVIENTEDIAEKLSYFDLFKEGTEKLSETIEYLNEIISIQKKTNIVKKKINLKDEIEKTKSALSLVIKESQIAITHTIPEDLFVYVIPAYLDSILLNLFTNAIKYKSPKRKAFLEIGYEINETYTVIIFKDNGLGLNLKKNGHKIFGMYKTFHGNEDAKGIGLYMTKNQLEAMDGKIEVESEVDHGSTFKIYLNEK